MYTLLKPMPVREELLKRRSRIFTAQDFGRIFHTPSYTTKYFLERQVHEGLFVRLKKGIYSLKTDLPAEEEIANSLYKPSYISFEYAMAYYHLLPEMPYIITSATTKPTRLFTTNNQSFSYSTLKKEAFTGYGLVKKEGRIFFIAEKEKAIVDYLYFVSLSKSPFNERLLNNLKDRNYYKIQGLNKEKLLIYAKLFKRSALIKLLKTLL